MDSLFPLGKEAGFRLNRLLVPDGPLLHSHPYAWCTGWILSGGYTHEFFELDDNGQPGPTRVETFRPGELNHMPAKVFHRVVAVEPGTWTAFRYGPPQGKRQYWVPGKGAVDWEKIDR